MSPGPHGWSRGFSRTAAWEKTKRPVDGAEGGTVAGRFRVLGSDPLPAAQSYHRYDRRPQKVFAVYGIQ